MFNILLSRQQKNDIAKWNYSVQDNSITTKWFTSFWDCLVVLIPSVIAPNLLSLGGLLCILYAFHLTYFYIAIYPTLVTIAVFILIFMYINLDAIDGKHARRTNNASPLGELFDHSCDSIGVVFLTLTFCYIYDIRSLLTQWYLVQSVQLIFLESHIKAYKERIVKFGKYTGPVEILMVYLVMILAKIFFDLTFLENWIDGLANLFGMTITTFLDKITKFAYYGFFMYILCVIIDIKFYETRYGLLISMIVRLISPSSNLTTYTILVNGLIMSVLISDMIVAKMAKSNLHPFVPILMVLSLFDNFFCIVAFATYYYLIFYEISVHLGISIFSTRS
jgi:phosphatidylglycerophosphate synthase